MNAALMDDQSCLHTGDAAWVLHALKQIVVIMKLKKQVPAPQLLQPRTTF